MTGDGDRAGAGNAARHVPPTRPDDDSVLSSLLKAARHDPATLGIILHGSRGAGVGDEESDYDLIWVLTEQEYQRRTGAGDRLEESTFRDGQKLLDIAYSCPQRLADPATPSWIIQGLATAKILLDKSGEVTQALSDLVTIPEEKARDEVAEMFDGYLNGFYRSIKAARRGNELGARLQTAASVIYLIRALFALERRWPPFHDRLATALDALEAQGWKLGELRELILEILRTGDPYLQIELEERVEALMRERGYGQVVDAWDGEIERVKDIGKQATSD